MMKSFPKMPKMAIPSNNKKFQRLRQQRREQLKSVISDVSQIATKEINRFSELATEILSDESDNPIVFDDSEEQEEDQEEISI